MNDEYQQVAAVLNMDIDVLARVAEDEKWSAEELREFIFRLKEQKDMLITNEEVRNNRYSAMSFVMGYANKGD